MAKISFINSYARDHLYYTIKQGKLETPTIAKHWKEKNRLKDKLLETNFDNINLCRQHNWHFNKYEELNKLRVIECDE